MTNLTSDLTSITTDVAKNASDITSLQSSKLDKSEFSTLSNVVGLSAASASNHIATKADIAALDGVMHFKGVVNAVPTVTTGYNVGDVVLVTGSSVEGDNGKEFVLVNTGTDTEPALKWEQIGDQDHYATKSYVDTGDSNTLTEAKSYTDGKITNISGTISSTYATKTELTGSAHSLSTDYNSKINGLSGTYATKTEVNDVSSVLSNAITAITDKYATEEYVNGISSALSTDYVGKIKAVDDKLADYALSADVTAGIAAAKSEVIGTTSDLPSADTVNGAKAYAKDYTDAAVAGLSADNFIKHGEVVDTDLSGFFILDCGAASLREGEPTTPIA